MTQPFSFLMTSGSFAQPTWVKEAMSRTEGLNIHPEATALVLHRVQEVRISKKGEAKTINQMAYKILSPDGVIYGTIVLPISGYLEIKKLKGWVIKPGGGSKKLPKENILTADVEGSSGYYDDSLVIIAVLPDVEPGVTVAFEWTTEEKGWTSLYQSFVFQKQQPVKFARYTVEIPKKWKLIQAVRNADQLDFKQQENLYIWTAGDMPYQPEEPLAPSWYYLSRWVSVNCFDPENQEREHFSNWPSVAKWCEYAHRGAAAVNEDITRQSKKIIKESMRLGEKLQAIATFVQKEIRYVAVEIGKGRWAPRAAGKTLFNRYGDCKDKTTLMRSLLMAAGIRAEAALVSLTYPVDPRLPSPFQFNHVIVAVPVGEKDHLPDLKNAIVDNWLFFDPTDPATQFGELPWGLQGSRILLGANEDTVLFKLPYPKPQGSGPKRRLLV